ncbi:MAG TPA: transglycosylase domain-containing protein, partial [Burkholderiales bacterium]|nr:transglycosylase domain-containing protein [Burkholderiales bacterium]
MAARRPRRFRLLVIGWKGLCYALGALVIAFALTQLWFFSHILYWTHFEPGSTAFMAARLEALRAKDPGAKLRREWVPYQRISVHLKRAVVAAEDAKFLDHEGFDWEAIEKAILKNEQQGRVVAGASTISQQLA